MTEVSWKTALTDNQVRLVELMQRINFGQIENLALFNGQPIFKPQPRITYKKKIGGDNNPRREIGLKDFALRKEVMEMFEHFKQLGVGMVRRIVIQYGLPRCIDIEEDYGM